LLKETGIGDNTIDLTPSPEGATYGMVRMFHREAMPSSDGNIPSFEYVCYLTATVSFHLGQRYHLFDKEAFLSRLESFYDKVTGNLLPDLWLAQILLVIALGKLLLGQNASPLEPPAQPNLFVPCKFYLICTPCVNNNSFNRNSLPRFPLLTLCRYEDSCTWIEE
jgi:hypothetical protein